MYTLDANSVNATMQLIDSETVIMNLTEANQSGSPKWRTEYSVKNSYGMKDLSPQSWDDLVKRMLDDLGGKLTDKAIRFYSKYSDAFPKCDDTNCRRKLICSFKKSTSNDENC